MIAMSERREDLVNECGIEYYAIIQSNRIVIDEEEYELYSKEFDVLYYLAQHPDWVLSRSDLSGGMA